MRALSKSKLLAFRQCPKRLWLEAHRPDLRCDSATAEARFAQGDEVGELARALYDPQGNGVLIDPQAEGFESAFARTSKLLNSAQPIFEAGLRADGAMAFADVMLPVKKNGKKAWRMVEVKSSTSVNDHQRDDVAVQALIARSAGVALSAIAVAHIDSTWVYPGGADYRGLLVENDLTAEAFARSAEVSGWIADSRKILAKKNPPRIHTGKHCQQPYECGFFAWCQSQQPQPEHPIDTLPGALGAKLSAHIATHHLTELRELPDQLLNARQQRVKTATVSGKLWFDREGAAQGLAKHRLPALFMDFETINFAVPIWKGTRPYQQIPFQFSVQRLSRTGKLTQTGFLDLSGGDPAKRLAAALIAACGERGPIFVYNAGFEKAIISGLINRFPRMATALSALSARVVDLLTVARAHYYHPNQRGSWSIKAVLPTLGGNHYEGLDGVQDGAMAMSAFLEAIAPATSAARKQQIERQLQDYCAMDTHAMVRLWSRFSGRPMP